jgi:hypothetical protein
MIGYEIDSSPVRGSTTDKTSLVENFKNGCKNDMATIFGREILRRSSFLGNLKPSNKKLGLPRTPT